MNRIAGRAFISLILALALVAGYGFFIAEYMTQAKTWVAEEGSPHIYDNSNGSITCGVVIDRDNKLLVDLRDGREYSNSATVRMAMIHWLGDRYNWISAPAITHYAQQIADYNLVDGLYSYADASATVELTISATVQQAALEALGDYRGTIAVINYETGEILCSVSTPTYDPDNIPDDLPKVDEENYEGPYEGVYMNRFTQTGSYIPGSIFKVVTLAAALECINDIQERTFTCNGRLDVEGEEITCEGVHGTQSLKNAFRNSCNCAFAQIAIELGGETLEKYVEKFGISEKISFDGITSEAGSIQASDAAKLNVGWSGVGQHKDKINPCAFLTFICAVAGGGQGVNPYVVEKITLEDTDTYKADIQERSRIMSESTAEIVQEYMRNNVMDLYDVDKSYFPGMTVCAKTGTAQVGGEKKPNAMLTGFSLDEEYPLAFIICVEDAGYGSKVCMTMASKVLAACKEVLDN